MQITTMSVKEWVAKVTGREVNVPIFDMWLLAHNHQAPIISLNMFYKKEGEIKDFQYTKELYWIFCCCDCGEKYTLVLEYDVKPKNEGWVICSL